MKKLLFLMFVVLTGMCITSCSSCGKDAPEPTPQEDEIDVVDTLVVEDIIQADIDDMNDKYIDDPYRWYETDILMMSFLDDEAPEKTVEGVSNTFEVVKTVEGDGYDTYVITYSHVSGATAIDEKHAFYVENIEMTQDMVKLTFDEAFDKAMQSNFVKPHSRYCTLRLPLGPNKCNVQYIFGNNDSQIYVDAVTGDVTDVNPAFKGFDMPSMKWSD